MSVKEFLKQQAVNIAVGGQYTLSNWFDAQGKPRTFACRTSRGFGTRVISHPLIFRCVRNSDSETTRKNNLLYGTSSCGRRPPSPREWGGGHEKRKSPGAFRLAGILCRWVRQLSSFERHFAVRRVHATTGARRTHAKHRGFQTDHSGGRRAWKQHRHAACSQVKLASSGSGRTAGAPDQEFLRCQRDAVGVGVIQQAAMVRLWNQFAGFRRGIFHAASDTVLITPCPRSRPPWPRRPVS